MLIYLFALLFLIRLVSLPNDMTVNLPPTTGAPFASPYNPTNSLALSAHGSFAALMHPKTYSGYGQTALFIIRSDGTRVILARPATQDVTGDPKSLVEFRGVALARDGTPFTTIRFLEGAYEIERVYMWNGSWHNELGDTPMLINSANATIAAADSPLRFVCNGNYLDTRPDIDQANHDPHYDEYQAFLIDRERRSMTLGYGSATSMRGQYVVGYHAGVRSAGVSAGGIGYASHALEWINGRRITLGLGIAYGVNASGDVVGDNEATYGQVGLPTLWRHGRPIRLSGLSGSAYAIGEDGTIVGQAGGSAFIVRGNDAARKVIRLEDLARPTGWHITSAYAIADTGRILAIGHRRAGPARILLLDPR